ncbi:MAG: lipopolysaccharide assembly protein LapB [Ideonella sp.]|nr:lipopolysaccharide assembly protein LapB [Ideonella sp.]
MEFDLQWLLLGLPLAFALGWAASRIDLRQWKREQREAPQAYTRGLSLLLNEQHDKAIDAFIEAVQQDPDSTDLHFALGNMFRRRGEYERAVRVHEHLLKRADLPAALRLRAQDALAQDFIKAGLLDRAEQAYRALEGTSFDTEARLALLSLHERSRDWPAAIADARKLEHAGAASFAARIAHYWCEIAEQADARQQAGAAADALQQARRAAPLAARPLIETGRRHARLGEHAQALQAFGELLVVQPAAFALVARDHAASALACGQQAPARAQLDAQYQRAPSTELLAALALLDPLPAHQRDRLRSHLAALPTLTAAEQLLALGAAGEIALDSADARVLAGAVGRAARPLQRYRCAACGFEAQRYFWQCPGCMAWDSYPTQRLEDLA